tara:strand:+ start:10358 stop:10696 length:339 start_codon:yes stop_codon:yes gene_type:complete
MVQEKYPLSVMEQFTAKMIKDTDALVAAMETENPMVIRGTALFTGAIEETEDFVDVLNCDTALNEYIGMVIVTDTETINSLSEALGNDPHYKINEVKWGSVLWTALCHHLDR